jgi:hypothetical protein
MLFLGAANQPGDGRRKRRIVERLDEAGASAQTRIIPKNSGCERGPMSLPAMTGRSGKERLSDLARRCRA